MQTESPNATIALVNRKGGCAKTTTTYQLAGCFAKKGLRVLVVDLDPQANLTAAFFGPSAVEKMPPQKSVMSVFHEDLMPDPDSSIQSTPFEGISILAGAHGVEEFNRPVSQCGYSSQIALQQFLRECDGRYDLTLLDCPPTLQLLTWSALVAAEYVVVPLQSEDFGSQGIVHIQRAIDLALQTYNRNIKLLGYLITLRMRCALHIAYERQLRASYGEQVFASVFPHRVGVKESHAVRKPIHFHKPKSDAAADVAAIADEMLSRIEAGKRQQPEFQYIGHKRGFEKPSISVLDADATSATAPLAGNAD